jgi:hypothetical protein
VPSGIAKRGPRSPISYEDLRRECLLGRLVADGTLISCSESWGFTRLVLRREYIVVGGDQHGGDKAMRKHVAWYILNQPHSQIRTVKHLMNRRLVSRTPDTS